MIRIQKISYMSLRKLVFMDYLKRLFINIRMQKTNKSNKYVGY